VLGFGVGWVSDNRINWMDMAVSTTAKSRAEIVRALLAALHHEKPRAVGSILNVGDNDVALTPLQSLGYREVLAQYEMRLTL
jgi:hypothetical protein